MRSIKIGNVGPEASVIGLGCMRMGSLPDDQAARVLEAALAAGITLFDHADIYYDGRAEEIFGRAIRTLGVKRESVVIQSKCGIRNGFFDFSREHILDAVDGCLRRLGTAYLDLLLLHRPDALMQPEEVAEAFQHLRQAGKVRHFGVSNQHPGQMALLRAAMDMPLLVNQLQMSVAHTPMLDHGLNVNMNGAAAINRDGGVLEYCRLHGVTVQPWSPLQFGFFGGTFIGHPDYAALNDVLRRIGNEQGVPPSAVALAWLLRHPAGLQPVVGSMNPDRIREMTQAVQVGMTRPEWYELYRAAGNVLP